MRQTLWKVILSVALCWLTTTVMAATVNINTADMQTLTNNITGVGPRRADAIISYRKSHGPFKDVQELTKVKGIGQKLIDKNKDKLVTSDTYSRFTDTAKKASKLR